MRAKIKSILFPLKPMLLSRAVLYRLNREMENGLVEDSSSTPYFRDVKWSRELLLGGPYLGLTSHLW